MTVSAAPPIPPACFDLPVVLEPAETLNDAAQRLALAAGDYLVVLYACNRPCLLSASLLVKALAKGASLSDCLADISLPELRVFDVSCTIAELQQAFLNTDVDCIGLGNAQGSVVGLLSRDQLPLAITDIDDNHTAILAQAFQQSPAALVLSELDTGIFVAVNQAFEALTGYQSDQVLGHASTDINFYLLPA